MKKIIEVSELEKSFGTKKVLKDITFHVNEGEIFGFLGPSGSGKTTTINILTGQLFPTSGTVKVADIKPSAFKYPELRAIGVVSDKSGYYEKMTVYDNLAIYAKLHEIKLDQVESCLKKVGLFSDKKKVAEKLSTGMLQRMKLARAILKKPKILFLDEPTSGLDPTTSQKIHQLLLSLKALGMTIFLTTHNMSEAQNLCDKVAFLNDGMLIEVGSPNELIKKYNDEKKVQLEYRNGKVIEVSFEKLTELPDVEELEKIHSLEPDLEDIFIKLTRGDLIG